MLHRPRPAALLFLLCLARPAGAGEAVKTAAGPATGFAVAGAVKGADVYIDGDKIGTTPLPEVVPLGAGEHTIRVVRPGFTPYVDVFKVRAGKVARLPVELIPFAGVLRLRTGLEKVQVFLDGKFIGEAPTELELKVGPHGVHAARAGYREEDFTITAVAGEIIEHDLNLQELPRKAVVAPGQRWYEKWWVWTIGATAVAAVAVAVIVPSVYYSRDLCSRLDAQVCIPVPAAANTRAVTFNLGLQF